MLYFLIPIEQVHGAATSSPVSPIVTNLFKEDFKINANNTATNPPRI